MDDKKLLEEIKMIESQADEAHTRLMKTDLRKLLAEEPPFGPSRAQRRKWERWRKKVARRQEEIEKSQALAESLKKRLNELEALHEQRKKEM